MIQFTSYQAPVDSFPLSEARIGLAKSGRYTGFDQLTAGTPGAGISVILGHSANTLPRIGADNAIDTSYGMVLTPQGVVVKGDDEFSFMLSNNTTLAIRYDILYLQYTWADDVVGGDILLGVIQGTVNGVIPALTSPATQVILGVVTVPQDATFSEIVYNPSQIPLPGGANIITNFPELDGRFARLAFTNRFTKTQSDNHATQPLVMDADNHVILGTDGNSFRLTGDPLTPYLIKGFLPDSLGNEFPVGTHLTITFVTPGDTSGFSNEASALGYTVKADLLYPDIEDGQVVPFTNGEVWEFTLLPNKQWWITNAVSLFYRELLNHGNRIIILENLMTNLGSAWVTVPEWGGPNGFTANFSSAGFSTAVEKLRYRKTMDGSLEITGGFNTTYLGLSGPQVIFTLPTSHRLNRNMGVAIFSLLSSPSNGILPYYGKITTDGEVIIDFTALAATALPFTLDVLTSR